MKALIVSLFLILVLPWVRTRYLMLYLRHKRAYGKLRTLP